MLEAQATGDRRALHIIQTFNKSIRLGQQLSYLVAGPIGHLRLGNPLQRLDEFPERRLKSFEVHLCRLATQVLRAVSHLVSPHFFNFSSLSVGLLDLDHRLSGRCRR
jgi:hypothetical protein